MPAHHLRALVVVTIAGVAVVACHGDTTAPRTSHPAELLRVEAPKTVAPGSAFSVLAYYGRGACDSASPVTERALSGARLGLQLTYSAPDGAVCPDILISESVSLQVTPPYSLPYTVRLQRPSGTDSVVVIAAE